MSSSNRTTSRGGKGPKGDKAHKLDKSDTAKGGGGGGSGDRPQAVSSTGNGGGGGDVSKQTEQIVRQIVELTMRTEDEVCLALHECDYDVINAVDNLLENRMNVWETTVKKKKNRQQSTSKAEQKADGGVGGDDWNDSPSGGGGGSGNGEKDKPRNKTGGPQRLHGRHNDNRGWRGREKQENERNLEDGGPNRDRRGRPGGPARGGGGGGRGRGGGRAGAGRYPQRNHRGGGGGGSNSFNSSRPIDTWDSSNNTWDNSTTTTNHTTEENWDEFPGADEWCGTLSETTVFTPSQPVDPVETETSAGLTPNDSTTGLGTTVQQSMDMLAQLQVTSLNSPAPVGGTLSAAQTQYFSQLTKLNNSGGDLQSQYATQAQQQQQQMPQPQQTQQAVYSAQQYGAQNTYNSYGGAYGATVQDTVPVQQQQPPVRTKTQRARVPPPSKIPATAVEMPGDLNNSIGYLDLEFGAMDIISSDANSFDGVNDSKYGNSTASIDNGAPQNNMDLSGQAQTSAAMDAYSPAKPTAQTSISSALSQSLSNTDNIPQASEHLSSGYSAATAPVSSTSQRSSSAGTTSNVQQTGTNTSALDQLNKQSEQHSYSQTSTYSTYQPKSTYPSNQAYSSSSSYNTTQTTSSYVPNQASNSYVNSDSSYSSQSANSSYQNAYSGNSNYQSNVSSTSSSFPTISQANAYPNSNQAYQQNASQSVYGANTGLNNSTYSGSSTVPYNSYNSNHKLTKEGYDNSTTTSTGASSTNTSTTSGLVATQTTVSATKANTALAKNSSGVVSNIQPTPPVMSTQYIMGQVPYFQAPMYSYEDVQMMQQRIPHMTTPFYEMSYQTPTAATTLRDGATYSLSTDGRFPRADSNASPVPSTQTSTQQPMLAAQTTGPYFFTPYNPMQPSYQFGAVYASQLPAGTNAHGSSNSVQYPKPATYGSGYGSGYDALSQSQDYNKGGYVGNTQGQTKGQAAVNASSTGTGANDISAMYGKSHTALGKVNSYEKQGFHSGTPPPFAGTLGQSALAPSTGYGPQMYIPTLPHQQHHSTPMMHQPLHQMEVRHQGRRMDSGNSTGQRTQASNQAKTGAKQSYPNNYWNQP